MIEQVNNSLKAENISKSYGSVQALNHISLNFDEKKIYGLFGRNGAGKSTLLDILSSRLFADAGNVTWAGKDVTQNPEIIAEQFCYMPEKHYFPPRFLVKKMLSFAKMSFPNFDGIYADKLCKIFRLDGEKKYEQLSRGYQSIFRIVIGLASNAPITILDEPVLGLDAVARDRFYTELIEQYSKNPRLFIISTHLIEESADLFNEAVIINNGKLVQQATVENLLSSAFYVSGKATIVDDFKKGRKTISSQTINNLKTAVIEGDLGEEKAVSGLHFSPLTIQKLFIHLTDDKSEEE